MVETTIACSKIFTGPASGQVLETLVDKTAGIGTHQEIFHRLSSSASAIG